MLLNKAHDVFIYYHLHIFLLSFFFTCFEIYGFGGFLFLGVLVYSEGVKHHLYGIWGMFILFNYGILESYGIDRRTNKWHDLRGIFTGKITTESFS